MKIIKPLSNDPAEMWLESLEDFESILRDPKFTVDMNHWLNKDDNGCYVCVAGASIACRVEGFTDWVLPSHFDEDMQAKLESIDCMRVGDFSLALQEFPLSDKEFDMWDLALARVQSRATEIDVARHNKNWQGLVDILRGVIKNIQKEYDEIKNDENSTY